MARVVNEAWESVRIQKAQADFQTRCRLQDVILGDLITSVFQPIVDIQKGGMHGLEALSRGPRDSQQHSPVNLFEAASATELTFELDRHCRRKALRTARDLPAPYRLFVNVVPASMYDPDFQGAALIKLLEGLGLSPDRIVLEVSEQYAIQNYTLFVEALQNFTQMGFSIAVDDIATFRPSDGSWRFRRYDGGGTFVVHGTDGYVFGAAGDIPIIGDFDSDGAMDDMGLYTPSTLTWRARRATDKGECFAGTISLGVAGYENIPLVGDIDSDGRIDDLVVYRRTIGNLSAYSYWYAKTTAPAMG